MYWPTVYKNNEDRYKGYTIRQLCQEMHDLYVSRNVKQLQKDLFRKATLPEYALNPHDANIEFVRNKVELVPLTDIVGRVAAKVRYLILQVCYVWFQEKDGVQLHKNTSLH